MTYKLLFSTSLHHPNNPLISKDGNIYPLVEKMDRPSESKGATRQIRGLNSIDFLTLSLSLARAWSTSPRARTGGSRLARRSTKSILKPSCGGCRGGETKWAWCDRMGLVRAIQSETRASGTGLAPTLTLGPNRPSSDLRFILPETRIQISTA